MNQIHCHLHITVFFIGLPGLSDQRCCGKNCRREERPTSVISRSVEICVKDFYLKINFS